MHITDAQRERLKDYAPSSIYMHADGSAVALLWERASVEIHRITPTGEVWTSKRAFDENEEWEHDVTHQPQSMGLAPIDVALLSADEQTALADCDRAFNLGKKHERSLIIKLLDTECECEHDHYCAYHRAITIILEASK
jgi:hypothetical protein